MTDTFDIDAMLADREAGNNGDWTVGIGEHDYTEVIMPLNADSYVSIADVPCGADRRRIARVPEMEAEIIRLREMVLDLDLEIARAARILAAPVTE